MADDTFSDEEFELLSIESILKHKELMNALALPERIKPEAWAKLEKEYADLNKKKGK